MLAVGKECGKLRIKRTLGTEIHGDFLLVMSDDQLSTLVSGWQYDDKCGDHAVEFFAIPVRQKEAALLINQELVKMRFELLVLETEFVLSLVNGFF